MLYREMDEITLKEMTKELCRELFRGYEYDPMIFADMSAFKPYKYSEESADAHFEKQNKPDRKSFAIMLDGKVIGEVYFKHIDRKNKTCELGIGIKSDGFKNRGYGTAAERLAVEYAFERMNMSTVFADTIHKNERSAHVLEKAGFRFVSKDEMFRYYRIDKNDLKSLCGGEETL